MNYLILVEVWPTNLSLSLHRTGHSTIVDEIQAQLMGVVPDLLVVAVGGGGLMNGVLEGLHRIGWGEIPVVAMETKGAGSLNACAVSGEWKQLDAITRWGHDSTEGQ